MTVGAAPVGRAVAGRHRQEGGNDAPPVDPST